MRRIGKDGKDGVVCCLGTAVMAGVGFELGCEGLERMGRMGWCVVWVLR